MPKGERPAEEEIACCEVPPPTCPRRYCAIAMRSLGREVERFLEDVKVPAKKGRGTRKRKGTAINQPEGPRQ